MQLGVCNRGEPHSYFHRAKEEHFYEEEKKVGRAPVNKESMSSLAESLPKKRSILPPLGLCYHCSTGKLPLLVSKLYLANAAGLCKAFPADRLLGFHLVPNNKLNQRNEKMQKQRKIVRQDKIV